MIMASSLALVGCPIILSCVHWYPHAINYPHYRICLGTRAIIYPHYPICLGTHAIIYPHYHMYLGTRAIIYPHYHVPTILYAWVVPAFIYGSEVGVCEALREGLIDNYLSSEKYVQITIQGVNDLRL